MAFHHMPTFLRSAIARDPFCHGGVITPNDVLRLEERFPTLFDKPAPPPVLPASSDNLQQSDDDDDDEDLGKCNCNNKSMNEMGRKKKVPAVLSGIRKPSVAVPVRRSLTKPNAPTKYSNVQAKINSNPPRKLGQAPSKRFSEFHRKCIENNTCEPTIELGRRKKHEESRKTSKSVAGVVVVRGRGGSKLTRPAQSFSLEDLRATLKKVMEEDALQYGSGLRYLDNKHREPSPYTEDLVKKFLGWKTQVGGGAQIQYKARKVDESPIASSRMAGQSQKNGEGPKLSSVPSGTMQEQIIPRIRSAPGFLRGISELPPVPKYQKKRMLLSMARESGRPPQSGAAGEVDSIKDMMCPQSVGGAGDGGESGRKHVTWGEHCEHESRAADSRALSSAENFKQRGRMRGTQIHFRPQKKTQAPEHQREMSAKEAFANDERYKVKSSYHQLLAARSEKTRYDLKGLLRKQDVPSDVYIQQLEREQRERKNEKEQREIIYVESSSDSPSENFARKMREMGQKSKEETNKALEKIAQELVYMEVLHQIDELKREQKQEEENKKRGQKQSSVPSCPPSAIRHKGESPLMPVNLPEFKGTTTTDVEADTSSKSGRVDYRDRNSKSSVQEITLKTPELTPPSVGGHNRKNGKSLSQKGNECSAELAISLHTPELSPSPNKRLITAIKERKQLLRKKQQEFTSSPPQHMDTDCSEMSDFVFSEPSRRQLQENHQVGYKKTQEKDSVKLETPQLSSFQKHKLSPNDQSAEKDESTLSGVPSTLLETPSKSAIQNEQNVDDNGSNKDEIKSSAKYSDDFIPEKEPASSNVSSHDPSFAHSAGDDVGGEKNDVPTVPSDVESDAESNDNIGKLNMSGETVIDLLSEGEFIGQAYRSPGELSLRQRHTYPPPRSFSSRSVAVSSQKTRQSSIMSSTIISGKERDNVESSISVLSVGAQIAGDRMGEQSHNDDASFGEYL